MADKPQLSSALEHLGLMLAVRPETFEKVREISKTHELTCMSGGVAARLISIMDAAKVVLDIELAAPAATSISGGAAGWIRVKDRLPEVGQKVDFWQQQHQMIGPGNLPDTIEAKAFSGWFDKTSSLSFPAWHDGPLKFGFYNNSNGLHDLALVSHWKPTVAPDAALAASPASVTSPVEPAVADKIAARDLCYALRELGLPEDGNTDNKARHLILNTIAATRAALTSSLGGVETGGWVPVEERLPEFVLGTDYSPRVLALGDGGIDGPQFVAYYAKSYGWFLAHDNQPNMKVTHWQLLPAAPHV